MATGKGPTRRFRRWRFRPRDSPVIATARAWAARALVGAAAAGTARAFYGLVRRRAVVKIVVNTPRPENVLRLHDDLHDWRSPSDRPSRWDRINHRGEPVTLLEGPAVVAGSAIALAVAPGVPIRLRAAGVVATVGCGALGAYDDLAGSGDARGLRGHLRALRSGEVTTGAVKVLGIGTVGVLAAALAGRPTPPRRNEGGWVLDVLLGGAVVASLANLVNLFDLRPGRAIKVTVALAGPATVQPGPAGTIAAVPVGAALGVLPEDLGERAMLGDCGANALGALIGVAVLARYGRIGRFAHLAGATALTLASERVSFTDIIERMPALRRLDALGRRSQELVESPT
jgi:UDP-GlcNAc:undecaprenyl-phosphate GlcNAc-1-phosphate transferase